MQTFWNLNLSLGTPCSGSSVHVSLPGRVTLSVTLPGKDTKLPEQGVPQRKFKFFFYFKKFLFFMILKKCVLPVSFWFRKRVCNFHKALVFEKTFLCMHAQKMIGDSVSNLTV